MTSNQTDAAGAALSSQDESTSNKPHQTIGSPAVRFASVNQEIEPEKPLEPLEGIPSIQEPSEHDIRELSATLHSTQLQNRRMSHFAFEPVSLPASRVPSNEDTSGEPSRHNTNNSSGRDSPRPSSLSASTMHTPPLTPAATKSRDAEPVKTGQGAPLKPVEANEDPSVVSPQISGGRSSPGTSRPPSSGQMSTRPTSLSDEAKSGTSAHHHRAFSIGPTDQDSVPTSREPSPSRPSAYTRPLHPAGDANDPYAANRRAPPTRNLDSIDPRFVFNSRRHRISPSSSSTNLPRSSRSSTDMKDKRSSFFGGSSKKESPLSHLHDEGGLHKAHGSMAELKRFLKLGSHKSKRSGSPAASVKSGTRTPTFPKSSQPLPFGEDHGLASKYGKFGKVLGAGAGGSVRVMKRSNDGTTFAVKEFRARHSYESEKEYAKKVTAEFCIGSALHHGNIIETLDIIEEKGKYYEVMEYAPYDLFAIVMTGKMSKNEVTCSFLQILSGVTYLHRMGLAHRDLKLDNVVVNEHGIMKIIDFGSASVFRYPFETGINLASGIVGSDPYLAPEVYDERKYDPQPTDIWSLAIIYCCMSLRRFPWKMPRMTDNSYKLFASTPTPGTDIRRGDNPDRPKSETDLASLPGARESTHSNPVSRNPSHENIAPPPLNLKTGPETKDPAKKPEVIKGPWRLLRLLPRESRHIIGRMLEIDPKKRATLDEILADPWIVETEFCRQLDGGEVVKAEGHGHTLEPPAAPAK